MLPGVRGLVLPPWGGEGLYLHLGLCLLFLFFLLSPYILLLLLLLFGLALFLLGGLQGGPVTLEVGLNLSPIDLVLSCQVSSSLVRPKLP